MLESLFKKVLGLRPATLLKKETPRQVLSGITEDLQAIAFFCNLSHSFISERNFKYLFKPNLRLLEKPTKLTILLSFHFANTFYTLYYECIL